MTDESRTDTERLDALMPRPDNDHVSLLIANLVSAARAAGFARGRREDDTEANRTEDAALDALKTYLRATPPRPPLSAPAVPRTTP